MSDERTRGIAEWFPDWLRQRSRQAVGALRGDELTWDDVLDRHGPQAAAVLYASGETTWEILRVPRGWQA